MKLDRNTRRHRQQCCHSHRCSIGDSDIDNRAVWLDEFASVLKEDGADRARCSNKDSVQSRCVVNRGKNELQHTPGCTLSPLAAAK